MASKATWIKNDLTQPQRVHTLGALFGDSDIIGAEVTSGGAAVQLTGTVVGYVILSDGTQITITDGKIDGNKVSITLTAACYQISGDIRVAIKINNVTVAAFRGQVIDSTTGILI